VKGENMSLELIGAIAVALVLLGLVFWLGYSAGESDTNRKMLEHRRQVEATERWKEIIEKLNHGGAL
jgi:hypothetical protein